MSQQPQEQYQFVEEIVKNNIPNAGTIQDLEFFYGGNFNLAVRIKIASGEYFIKWNLGEHKGLFEAEAKNLQLLAQTKTVSVPEVIAFGKHQEKEFLIMECIHSSEKSDQYFVDLGISLAALHQHSHPNGFGLDYDNFMGASEQKNPWNADGNTFFIENRLLFQLEKALYDRKIDSDLVNKFEHFFQEIPSIFPKEKSALIHGDLWSGNTMVNEKGLATLVDPTCYYGFREAEIAFTTMFGGFEESFYAAYHEQFPLEKGFHARIPFYNLYPLLVHVNLFGEGYVPTIQTILKAF
jgi:fructosamine-3-kinase